MKKSYRLENLDCAGCAAKMEAAINKIDGVKSASISFMSARLIIETDDDIHSEVLDKAQKAIKKVERDCLIVR